MRIIIIIIIIICVGQQENNPITISRHVESDHDRGSRPHEPTLRDPPHGENLNVEPVLQSAGVKDGETSVNQEEATSTSPKIQQGRSISSQVAAVNATAKEKCRAVRNQLVLQNKTQTPLQMKTSSLIRVESKIGVPSRQDRFLYQGGLERARSLLLWFAGLEVF